MTPTARNRCLLALLAVVIVVLSLKLEKRFTLFAQESPTASPTFPFAPTPTFTPFGLPPAPPPPPQFTPTPTLDLRVVNEITQPKGGDAVAGLAPIVGTALINDFLRYEMHISPTGAENWSWLTSNMKVVRDGILYVLDTHQLPDGLYDLRVRAITAKGNYSEAFLRKLEIRNANPPTPTPAFDASGVPQPVSPLLPIALAAAVATPTPIYRSYIENAQGIYEPQNGAILRGQVPVVGTANGKTAFNPFERYEIYVTPSGTDEWSWLYTGNQQLWQSPIYTLDTTRLADGFYDLRLRVVYRDSNYDEYYVTRLHVANESAPGSLKQQGQVSVAGTEPGIYFPRDNAQISGVLDLVGTTSVPDLLRWEIYWSPAGQEDWTFLVSDTSLLVNRTLARLDLSLLPSGSYDFRLRIVRRDYTYTDYHVRDVQSTPPTPVPYATLP